MTQGPKTTPPADAAEDAQNAIFNIEKIYTKSLSLESPQTPGVFLEQAQPEVEIKFNIRNDHLQDFLYESTLTGTVTAKVEKRVIFLCEVSQSAIFHLENMTAKLTDILLNVTCPSIVFPYLREAVSETISRAGFPPVYLAPINFDAMYQQQIEQTGNA